ncbi:CpsD/CapB family tyrosine-protein kinase [Salinicoccus roseus]|uniref:CpsD/CapB family tyrosine-protein kinase n=1 Tax=Salinicoccus roseus TaxID=45670 RepID=UPI000F4FB0A1|nr:CpsD/CapB family tyrosine-protein kinase [Salinicoccus roseus]RPE54778.1 capsular exopolysaccharide synthesis family protein [Salinicoccus roseus]GGA62685.1 capsular polysaccharide biosynthesis protein Cap5B [Salinicoccus roseus]
MFGKKRSHSYVSGPRELIVKRQPKSPVSEQFRTVRTNIMYSNIDTEIKTVLVTSATPGAGKSTTAANLAVAYAQSGKKTLLMDADMRRPTTHYTFEVTNQRGLSTVIVNDVPVENVVRETEIENLDIVSSGPIPPNPSELLSSNKMTHLLKTFSMHYDMVIIDSPPLLAVTDAQVLSKITDGTVLVTNVAENNRDKLREAKDLLDKADANILGVVMNNKKMNTKKDDYYYYYGSE